jgi:hypothetical protein
MRAENVSHIAQPSQASNPMGQLELWLALYLVSISIQYVTPCERMMEAFFYCLTQQS